MARRFSAPIVRSIFTPDTWDLHQASVESGTVDKLMPSASPDSPVPFSTGVTSDELGRTESRLRRITPGTIREGSGGLTASPFPEHRIAPKKLKDPLAYMHIPMPGGAPTPSGMSMPGSVSMPGSAPEPEPKPGEPGYTGLVPVAKRSFSAPILKLRPKYDKHTLAHYPGTRVDSTGKRIPMMTLDEMDAARMARAMRGFHPDSGPSIDSDPGGVLRGLDYTYSLDSIRSWPGGWKGYGGLSKMDVYEAGKAAHARAYRDKYAAYL